MHVFRGRSRPAPLGREFVVAWQDLVLFDADPNAWSDGLLAIANAIEKTMDAYHP